MASTASILLALLKHAPAERVEVMLDAVVLLHLWIDHGHSKESLEAKLRAGTKPGAILLELFELHGADALWESLPPRMRKTTTPPADAPRQKLTELAREDPPSKVERWLSIAGLCGVVWSAMWIVGTFPEWGAGVSLGPIVSALLGGVTCGAMLSQPRSAGAIGGLVGGAIVILTAWVIRDQGIAPGRLVAILAVLPGVLVGLGLSMVLVRVLRRDAAPRGF